MFFEGAEKKLEILYDSKIQNLLELPDSFWEKVVESCGAKILSHIQSPHLKAYLLSESSLFVAPSTVIMITCGTTKLVNSFEYLVEQFGIDSIHSVFYERKNEIFGHYQASHFFDDVRQISSKLEGRAFRFGDECDHHVFLYQSTRSAEPTEVGNTLEILMNGIGNIDKLFSKSAVQSTAELRQRTGLDKLLHGFEIDDFIFDPVGYSLNAVRGKKYVTIHVTPQNVGSYCSFETNMAHETDCGFWISEITKIFQPETFGALVFNKQNTKAFELPEYTLKSQFASHSMGLNSRFFVYYKPNLMLKEAFEFSESNYEQKNLEK